MVSDTRPPPHREERHMGKPPHRMPTEPPRHEHRWKRWVEQSFESLEANGPIYRCDCGAERKGIP